MKKLQRKKINNSDVDYIIKNLRSEDLEEVKISFGEDFKNELKKSLFYYNAVIAVDSVTKKPILIYGVCPFEEDIYSGLVFMLSTPDIVHYKRSFFFELKKELNKFDKKFYFLCNKIYSKNFLAKKWLKWAGFQFDIPKPFSMNIPDGFEYFYRIRTTNNKKGLH